MQPQTNNQWSVMERDLNAAVPTGLNSAYVPLIIGYLKDYKVARHLKETTMITKMRNLKQILIRTPELNKEGINEGITRCGDELAVNTYRKCYFEMNFFCQYLHKEGKLSDALHYHVCMDKLEIESIDHPEEITHNPEDMLKEDEVKAIIASAANIKERAMLSLEYEGALRGAEVRALTWDMLKEDATGMFFTLAGKNQKKKNRTNANKTKFERYIRIIDSLPLLNMWRAVYPHEIKPGAYVFPNNQGGLMSYPTHRDMFERICKKAKVSTAEGSTHLLRHARITHMINHNVPESVIKLLGWGDVNTKAFKAYANIKREDIDTHLLRERGMQATTQGATGSASMDHPSATWQCTNCKALVHGTMATCPYCRTPKDGKITQSKITASEFNSMIDNNLDLLQAYIDSKRNNQ